MPITLPTELTDSAALQRLLTWLSPAFPVGSFSWSQGLESAIADGRVSDAAALSAWLAGSLHAGSMRNDAIILARAHRTAGDADALREINDLAIALAAPAERAAEIILTGEAFAAAARAWPSPVFERLPTPLAYPVAVGAIAGAAGIALQSTLIAALVAAVQAQVSVAVRLVPLGQAAGLRVLAELEPAVAELAGAAATAGLDAIGGIAYAADIAQMRHENLEPRIFRS